MVQKVKLHQDVATVANATLTDIVAALAKDAPVFDGTHRMASRLSMYAAGAVLGRRAQLHPRSVKPPRKNELNRNFIFVLQLQEHFPHTWELVFDLLLAINSHAIRAHDARARSVFGYNPFYGR